MQLKLSLTAAVLFENAQAAIFRILEFRTEHQLMLKLVQEQQLGTTAVQEVLVRVEEEILTYIKTKSKLRFLKRNQTVQPGAHSFLLFKMYIALVYDWEKRHEPLSEEKIAELIELYFYAVCLSEMGFFIEKQKGLMTRPFLLFIIIFLRRLILYFLFLHLLLLLYFCISLLLSLK